MRSCRPAFALHSLAAPLCALVASEIGTAVYVIKSSARSAFNATEIIEIATIRFHDVTPQLISHLRRDWRRTTMEAMHARLRVTELYEAQQQVGTFAVDQARSLILTLHLEGSAGHRLISEAEVLDALARVLPEVNLTPCTVHAPTLLGGCS